MFLAWLAADCAASPCINGSHNSYIAVITYHSNSAPRIRQLDRWRFISLYYYYYYYYLFCVQYLLIGFRDCHYGQVCMSILN